MALHFNVSGIIKKTSQSIKKVAKGASVAMYFFTVWLSLRSLLSQIILWLRISKKSYFNTYGLITNKTIHSTNLILKAWSLNSSLLTLSTILETQCSEPSTRACLCIAVSLSNLNQNGCLSFCYHLYWKSELQTCDRLSSLR